MFWILGQQPVLYLDPYCVLSLLVGYQGASVVIFALLEV